MKKEIEDMISKMDKVLAKYDPNDKENWGVQRRHLDFLDFNFKVDYSKILFNFNWVSVNNIDIPCDENDIDKGPFIFYFNDIPIDEINNGNINDCTWEEDDQILIINNKEYKFLESDIVLFVSDFYGDDKQVINTVMKHFCEWVKKNYM